MILRVRFRDNDFCTVVCAACEDLMYSILNGYSGEEGLKRYGESKAYHGLENLRKAIVLGSYGHLIANNAVRVFNKIEYDFTTQEQHIAYLDKNITIEEIESFVHEWENSEVCYIDFKNKTIQTQ